MRLSKTQIEQIKKFIRSRGFTHIEVEMEILDHVATAVEEKLEKDPKKSIERCIQEVHAGFGPLGFSTFEDSIHKSINQMLKKQFWRAWKYYFINKGAMTTVLIFVISSAAGIALLPSQYDGFYRFVFYLQGFLITLGCAILIKRRSKKWFKKSIVIALTGSYSAFAYLIFGQAAGLLIKDLLQFNYFWAIIAFALFSTIIVTYGLAFLKLFDFSFKWTYERYLKYA